MRSLESIDLQGGIPEEIDDFNLLFVSIAAWHKLMNEYEAEVRQYFYSFIFFPTALHFLIFCLYS